MSRRICFASVNARADGGVSLWFTVTVTVTSLASDALATSAWRSVTCQVPAPFEAAASASVPVPFAWSVNDALSALPASEALSDKAGGD